MKSEADKYSTIASPLMHMAGGTKKTERRRSRSRSRQRIESELAKKIDDIPIIHDTVEYLLSTYSLIKVLCVVVLQWLPQELQ